LSFFGVERNDLIRYAPIHVNSPAATKAMMTSSKLGRALGLSKRTVLRLARDGLIPSIILPSGHRRFDLDEVRAALASPDPILIRMRAGGKQ